MHADHLWEGVSWCPAVGTGVLNVPRMLVRISFICVVVAVMLGAVVMAVIVCGHDANA
jgi:hypothetical protein